jgi:glycosyltransferase 2 family protein
MQSQSVRFRRAALIVVSVLLSGVLLWLALRDIDFSEVGEKLAQINLPIYLISLITTVPIGLWLRGVRWRGLLNFRIPHWGAFHILNAGMMINQLPLRAGEVARGALVMRYNVPFITGITSIVVERLLDVVMVIVLLAWAVSSIPNIDPAITASAVFFGTAAVIAFGVMLFFARFPHIAHRILDTVERLLPIVKRLHLARLVDNVIEGLHPLTNWRAFAHAVGWTLLSWAASISTYYLILVALNVQGIDLLLAAVICMALASLAIAVPPTVAGIGAFQYAFQLGGRMVGMSDADSAAFGIIGHATALMVYATLGIIAMITLGASFSSLLSDKPKNEDTATGAAL